MGSLLSGMDLCFNPAAPGTPDAEGHYPLNFGLIQRVGDNDPWTKVNGFSENVGKNTDFVITLYDLSGTLSQVDFVTIAWRPDSSDSSPPATDSPFTPSDFDTMIRGKVLQRAGNWGSVGCGQGISGNVFTFGTYTFKNSGPYEVTIEARVTYQGRTLEFKCDPKIIVGT
jgi:hypothetical protein